MAIDLIGWDIGGAHLKAAALEGGRLAAVRQEACPLWLGIEHFHRAARAILADWRLAPNCRHAATMTGELADLFESREAGVFGLLNALAQHAPAQSIAVFAGPAGFLPMGAVRPAHVAAIASANWLATGQFAAARLGEGLLLDIGSTTADLLILAGGAVRTLGHSDAERLRHEELVYTGAVRTSLMALADRAPLEGEWLGVMAEHFATTADVYRLTGELPEHADQSATADGADKSEAASARRLARLVGRDAESLDLPGWRRLAGYFRQRQLARLEDACQRQLSRGLLGPAAPFVGAGVGRFLVQELARRLAHPYTDFADMLPAAPAGPDSCPAADCAPAVALACLAGAAHG